MESRGRVQGVSIPLPLDNMRLSVFQAKERKRNLTIWSIGVEVNMSQGSRTDFKHHKNGSLAMTFQALAYLSEQTFLS